MSNTGAAGKRAQRALLSALLTGLECLAYLPAKAQVVTTRAGTVEFLGLETWSPAQIQERLGYSSPEKLHYCAEDLKRLGFPEAVVVAYTEQGGRYSVITVVEPQRANEIAYKSRPARRLPLPSSWEALEKVVKTPDFLAGGILDYSRTLPGALADRPWLADGTAQSWWATVRSQRSEANLQRAEHVLAQSDDGAARALAAVVLMNFASRDAAWRSLVSGLRDSDSLVQAACLESLNSLATYHPRKVNWAPSATDLKYLLHGTDLFAFQFLLKALVATQADPPLARPLLGNGGGRLVLAYLRASHDEQRTLAHAFLVRVHGSDLGNDPESWDRWVNGLEPTPTGGVAAVNPRRPAPK